MTRDLVAAGLRLRLDPAYEAFARDVLAPGAADLARLPGAQVVKHNRVRTVVRLPAPGGDLFVKRFRALRPGERLLSLVRGSPARREWAALVHLAGRGVPCPPPVLLAEERRRGLVVASVLATRALEAEGLPERLRALRAAGARRDDLLAGLARLMRAVFAAGVDHPDLHAGNVLVRGPDELFVLDLHSARLRAPGAALRRRRLGRLVHSLGLFEPDDAGAAGDELAALARAYAPLDPALGAADALAAALRAEAARFEAVRLVSRDRRCLVESTLFAVERTLGRRVWRRRELTPEQVAALVDAPPLALLHAHPRGRSRLELVAGPDGRPLVRKRYPLPGLAARLEALLAPTALRAWRAARACEVRGVPAPRHLALVVEGTLWPTRATLLMEHLEGVTMLHRLFEPGATPPAPAARRALARALGRVLGRLHATGLAHHDLAAQNLLVRPRGADAWDVWVIDLDEVRRAPLDREAKLRALTQLADLPPGASRTDRARFFRAYLAAGGDAVLAPELAAWGALGLGRRVAERLAARAAAKARRAARRAT